MSLPEGFHTVSPYLLIPGAHEAVDFYKRAFAATELLRMDTGDGRVMHAELLIGDSPVMIGDPTVASGRDEERGGERRPLINLFLYVEDVDSLVEKAAAAGAKIAVPVEDHPMEGDRRGALRDPFGIVWWVATHTEPLSRSELQRRWEEQKAG